MLLIVPCHVPYSLTLSNLAESQLVFSIPPEIFFNRPAGDLHLKREKTNNSEKSLLVILCIKMHAWFFLGLLFSRSKLPLLGLVVHVVQPVFLFKAHPFYGLLKQAPQRKCCVLCDNRENMIAKDII